MEEVEVATPVNAIRGRIALAYDECERALAKMAEKADKFIVYEHHADDGCARTHIHFLAVQPSIGIEGLKKVFRSSFGDKIPGGNKFWSITQADDPDRNVTYMSKGSLAYKMAKGYSPDEVEALRLSWVDLKPANSPAQETPKKYDELTHIIEDWGPLDRKHVTFDEIRSWVFAWYWRRDARIPHATAYKRMAGTLFLRIAEVQPQMVLDVAMEEVKNLWY